MSLFTAEGLVKRFGGLLATDHVDLAVEAGEIHALIGPNGAGKSTLVNLISGLLPADAGRIVLDGVELTALAPHARTRAGLARCFQITSVFRNDSVRDNLLLAVQAQAGSSFRCLSRRDAEHALQERAEALAQRVGLTEGLERNAGTLAHGLQKRLDLAVLVLFIILHRVVRVNGIDGRDDFFCEPRGEQEREPKREQRHKADRLRKPEHKRPERELHDRETEHRPVRQTLRGVKLAVGKRGGVAARLARAVLESLPDLLALEMVFHA